jgi:hypothetical protein
MPLGYSHVDRTMHRETPLGCCAQKLRPQKTARRSYSTLLALTIFHGSLGSPRLGAPPLTTTLGGAEEAGRRGAAVSQLPRTRRRKRKQRPRTNRQIDGAATVGAATSSHQPLDPWRRWPLRRCAAGEILAWSRCGAVDHGGRRQSLSDGSPP